VAETRALPAAKLSVSQRKTQEFQEEARLRLLLGGFGQQAQGLEFEVEFKKGFRGIP